MSRSDAEQEAAIMLERFEGRHEKLQAFPSPFVAAAVVHPNPSYDKYLFELKLLELGLLSALTQLLMDQLPDHFSFEQLTLLTSQALRRDRLGNGDTVRTVESVLSLARANYEISVNTGDDCSERAIFPTSPTERRGIEDARFVAFEDGGKQYIMQPIVPMMANLHFPSC